MATKKFDMYYDLSLSGGMNSAYTHGTAITPTDNVFLPQTSRALWVGTGGNITVLLSDDTVPVTLNNVPAGLLLVRACQVFATGTTASNIVSLW